MIKYFHALLLLMGISSASAQPAGALQTVPKVDLQRYLGKWYEIASFPQRFQKGCSCTGAEYSLRKDGNIAVTNSCMKEGHLKVRTAKAKVVDKTTNAKLSVQFFWPFQGKYWIIDLAEDYSYAVVGHPNREYLWILSRTPEMDKATYSGIVRRVAAKGFDTSLLQYTIQRCN